MIDEKNLPEMRAYGNSNVSWPDGTTVTDLLNTIESLWKENADLKMVRKGLQKEVAGLEENCKRWAEENEEIKKIKGLCLSGGCVHISPAQFEKLQAVARNVTSRCDQFHCGHSFCNEQRKIAQRIEKLEDVAREAQDMVDDGLIMSNQLKDALAALKEKSSDWRDKVKKTMDQEGTTL